MSTTRMPPTPSPPARHRFAAEAAARELRNPADAALNLLQDGRDIVRWLLARHAQASTSPTEAQRSAGTARRLNLELAVQLHVEEELLYPRLRERLADPAPVDQAEVEHECLRQLLERLVGMDPQDPLFDARLVVLGEIHDLHLQRMARQVLPLVPQRDLHDLGLRMADRRDELLVEMADHPTVRIENEEADPVGEPPR